MKIKNEKGLALIEVMIAIVVFSFGILGVAGVMTVSIKNNHNGYMRSQAAFLASSAIDMMRRNQLALWGTAGVSDFDGTYSGYTDVSTDCATASCTSADMAQRDVTNWGNMIDQLLPNSSGQIQCINGGTLPITAIPVMMTNPAPPGPDVICEHCAIEPYNGFCNITITWSESNVKDASSTQTLLLIGKP